MFEDKVERNPSRFVMLRNGMKLLKASVYLSEREIMDTHYLRSLHSHLEGERHAGKLEHTLGSLCPAVILYSS